MILQVNRKRIKSNKLLGVIICFVSFDGVGDIDKYSEGNDFCNCVADSVQGDCDTSDFHGTILLVIKNICFAH